MPKVLIVEDNEENWEALSRRLQRRGFDVAIATDGQQALETARSASPDLILMDMNLPILDGWETTRRLRGSAETRAIPIIALTAHAMGGDRDRALQAGCDDYHTKPIELPRLLAQIERLLERSDSADDTG